MEVLRATGIRVEELAQLSHHSLVQYRLPSTGELVPLLQIAPSKTDAERLLVVSPELADVLSAVITRVRDGSQAVPLVAAYDDHERTWLPPAPILFQRKIGAENRAFPPHTIRLILSRALIRTGLTDPVDGTPLHCTPHDFRRIFLTDAIMNGLPPHIAQIIAGHRDINVTLGYKAVYPDEAIQAHLAFLARRRARRPTEEYRTPTDEEWAGIPRALRTPQSRHRHLRTGIRHPLHPRTRLHPLPRPLARPSPAAPARRDPRQPDRPHRRSRTRRLDRRSRRPQDQPRRRPGQARPNRPARQDRQHRRPGHTSLPPGHQPLKVSQPLTRQLKTKIIFLSSENAEKSMWAACISMQRLSARAKWPDQALRVMDRHDRCSFLNASMTVWLSRVDPPSICQGAEESRSADNVTAVIHG